MSFEDAIIRKIDRSRENRLELTPIMRAAHDRAQKEVFAKHAYAIQAPEFISTYGEEAVKKDMLYVLKMKKKFEAEYTLYQKNSKLMADVLEAIILTNAKQNAWFGDAEVLKTSQYDDIENGTDMYAEWYTQEEGSRVLALAVDVTFSKSQVQKKLKGIKDEIDADTLGQIRYFKDTHGDFMGTRNNVPRTVIGVSPETLDTLAQLWMNNDMGTLASHQAKHAIAEQINTQLTAMLAYATRHGRKKAARAYTQALHVVQKLRDPGNVRPLKDDPVVQEILEESKKMLDQ